MSGRAVSPPPSPGPAGGFRLPVAWALGTTFLARGRLSLVARGSGIHLPAQRGGGATGSTPAPGRVGGDCTCRGATAEARAPRACAPQRDATALRSARLSWRVASATREKPARKAKAAALGVSVGGPLSLPPARPPRGHSPATCEARGTADAAAVGREERRDASIVLGRRLCPVPRIRECVSFFFFFRIIH